MEIYWWFKVFQIKESSSHHVSKRPWCQHVKLQISTFQNIVEYDASDCRCMKCVFALKRWGSCCGFMFIWTGLQLCAVYVFHNPPCTQKQPLTRTCTHTHTHTQKQTKKKADTLTGLFEAHREVTHTHAHTHTQIYRSWCMYSLMRAYIK